MSETMASVEWYRAVMDASPVPVAVSDDHQRIRYVNRAFVAAFGYVPDDVPTLSHWWALACPEPECRLRVADNWMAELDRVKQTREPFLPQEFSVRCADGSFKTVLATATPLSGSPRGEQLVVLYDITLRKTAEEALRASKERYRAIFNQAADGMVIMDLQGKVLDVNPAFARSHGYTVDEMIALGLDGIDVEGMSPLPARVERLLAGESLTFEAEHRAKDGTQFPVEVSAALVDLGETKCILAFHRDISDRKQAERALGDITELFSLFVQNSPIYTFIKEVTATRSCVLYASENFEEMIGIPGRDMVGKTMAELFPVELAQKMTNDDIDVVAGGVVLTVDEELNNRCYTTIKFPITQGERTLLAGYTIDNTQRKRAEEMREVRLRLLEFSTRHSLKELLRRTLDEVERMTNSVIGFYHFVEPDQRTLTLQVWSTRTSREYCTAAGEGQHYAIDDAGVWVDCVRQGHPVIHNDYQRVPNKKGLPEGHAPLIRELVVPIFREGNVVAILGVGNKATDYTDDDVKVVSYLADVGWEIAQGKRAEEEKLRLEAQLLQSQKMDSVGRLAGGVAHDFNNMLGVILGHVEMALEQVDPALPLYADLQEIRVAAERSASLTRQLLAFARKQVVTPTVLDLNDTLETMLKMLRRLIGEDIELLWQPASSLWPVRMDPSQIDQILANLCVNARDAIRGVGYLFIETANVTLDEIDCVALDEAIPGEYVRITVKDSGGGMDMATRKKIFEPFFTTKPMGQGTGLGLATVYGIVKQNNGFISVFSEPEQGATFMIYLPRHVDEAQLCGVVTTVPRSPGGHETVLVVEDEATILKMVIRMLLGMGYSVLAASSPGEAIRVVQDHDGPIHLLLTDVIMPAMNGRDLAAKLQVLHPDLRCLFMSGYPADVIGGQGVLEEGMHFLQKPFSHTDLAGKMREALDPKLAGTNVPGRI